MGRLARIVISDLPHHVTQRGNRREATFFEDGDHEVYLGLLAEQASNAGVEVWAYCLIPNHVYLILKPTDADGLGRAVGEAHRRDTNFIVGQRRMRTVIGSVIISVDIGCAPQSSCPIVAKITPAEMRQASDVFKIPNEENSSDSCALERGCPWYGPKIRSRGRDA